MHREEIKVHYCELEIYTVHDGPNWLLVEARQMSGRVGTRGYPELVTNGDVVMREAFAAVPWSIHLN